MLVGTADRGGACDVSPCGDRPGFALVLDEKTLAIPEPPGNRRLDSLLNVLETGTVGLLFVVPGFEETLRINGRTSVVRDADVLGRHVARDKAPEVAMGVEVGEWLPALRQGVQALGTLAGRGVARALRAAFPGKDLPRPGSSALAPGTAPWSRKILPGEGSAERSSHPPSRQSPSA